MKKLITLLLALAKVLSLTACGEQPAGTAGDDGDTASVESDGRALYEAAIQLACDGIRFSTVFQEDRLLPWKTVVENAALFSDKETACRILTQLGLGDSLDALPETLSGGMKRRAALGRALAHPFDALVLDEALTGLDTASRAQCLAAINEAVGPRTLVMASHNADDAAALHAQIIGL